MDTTLDAFLGGRLQVEQPSIGYRAATDPVLLAASVDAKLGQTVLDVGCGVGVASLCLGARVDGVHITGLEIQSAYVDMALRNAKQNKVDLAPVHGDLQSLPSELHGASFDHVITNPPFFGEDLITPPASLGKDTANREQMGLDRWIALSLKRLKPKGWFSIIHLADRLPDILNAVNGPLGDVRVKPIAARQGRAANRVIVQGRKGSKGSFTLLSPFIMHDGVAHTKDGDDYSEAAQKILREGHRFLIC